VSEGPATDLGTTARWTAAVRAAESQRTDRLFDDPWAAELAGEPGRAWAASRPEVSVLPMVLRTRFYDDFLQRAAQDAGIRQLVLLAAGLDTRAFRLDWPDGTVIYELDRPDVLRHKAQILTAAGARPRCTRQVCPTDLTHPDWPDMLVGAGYDRSAPAAFLGEGFLFYLPTPVVLALLDRITALAATGSELGFDIVNSLVFTHPVTRPWIEMQAAAGAPWVGALDDPVETLRQRGWTARLSQCGADDAHHGRWPYPELPITAPDLPHHWLVTATR
jgi:methyltransferase (TIGR00027 family)